MKEATNKNLNEFQDIANYQLNEIWKRMKDIKQEFNVVQIVYTLVCK
jgi:hypothetical protein